ncbi:hypothetical protein HZP15_10240 [Elizabethkingia anophelis]|nr:hypothetical protein [Elizabethkingia anophelis]
MYELKFIQKDRCKDGSDHLFTYVYKFFNKNSQLHYIIRAEYHNENVIGLKFYCKKDKRSEFKYNKIINKGGYLSVINILGTCTKLIPILLEKHPDCSFGFCSSRSIDFSNSRKLTEDIQNNQRFRVYTKFLQKTIGNATFTHIEYPDISSYLLVNNNVENVYKKEERIKEMFERTYINIPDISD